MGRTCDGLPVKHIISLRVNEEEMKILQELASERGINLSTLMRQSVSQIIEDANSLPKYH